MTNNNFTENHQQLAQQLFCANSAYSSLIRETRPDNNEDKTIVIFNDIFQLVKGNNQKQFVARKRVLIKKINADLNLRKTYIQLIEQLKFAQSDIQVAASSGEILPERETDHFSLKFKRDKSQPTQVYVILSINHPTEQHLNNAFTLHITNNNEIDCLSFPIINNGRSQLLMEDNESSFKLLTDPNSRLYLM